MIQVVRRELSTHMRAAVSPIAGLRSVAVLVAFDAGQWFEPRGAAGVARLTAQTLLRGTDTRDAGVWSEALDSLGAGARLTVGSHAAFFTGQCLSEDLAAYLELVADAVLHPSFAGDQVELVRSQALAELEEDERDTRAVVDRTWRELAYPVDHPFRTRSLGAAEVVRTADVASLRRFHRKLLGGRAVAIVAGGIEPERAFSAVTEAFAGWPAAQRDAAPLIAATSITGSLRTDVVVADKTQCDIVMGWLGPPRPDPRFAVARVANMVFAQDTFASRVGHVVRDQLGLAYYCFSSVGTSFGQSPWTLRMGVNPENVERALAAVDVELSKILAGEIADDDVTLAKDKLIGELDVALESAGGVAQRILEAEVFELGADHHVSYLAQLQAVTKDDIVAIVREFLPLDHRATAVAGPPLPTT